MDRSDAFTSRWGMLLAMLGMAVGTGNIWRFPRVIARNGGGAFLVPWFLFLFLWSVPLLITELAIGRKTRRGTVGSFASLLGPRWGWMGGYVAFCSLAIMLYYAVVTGWTIRYLVAALSGSVLTAPSLEFWHRFSSAHGLQILFTLLAYGVAGGIVYFGVSAGIERASKILMPTLFLLLVVGAVRALTLPGAVGGLEFFFRPDWRALLDHRVWLEALSQSAWSTGAGWGLVLTYAVYARQHEDAGLNGFLVGLGDNSASLLAGLMIFPAVFALAPSLGLLPHEIVVQSGPANTGMAFIWIPELFRNLPLGRWFLALFFLALAIAAITSLISMIELGVRLALDRGVPRSRAVLVLLTAGFVLSLPAASNAGIFENQDWVWGLGLMLSGLFFAVAVIRYGPSKFRREFINLPGRDLPIGRWYDVAITVANPLLFAAMVAWWFYQSATSYDPQGWWHPFHRFSLGTCLFQWGLVVLALLLLNRHLVVGTLREGSRQ
ncbi:MAG: sodium-dependent transporter [candidate division KSB1 bacterium]|nr:sodium-dependent transporter [candidate division KSB1 bacterium]